MNDLNWYRKVLSININSMSPNLWSCLTHLPKAMQELILIQETKICDLEVDCKCHCILKMKSDGVDYTNPSTGRMSEGLAVLLSARTSSLITNRQVKGHGLRHKVIALTGSIRDRFFRIQSIYSAVNHNCKAEFSSSMRRDAAPIHIIGGDMNCVLDPDLDREL